MKKEETRQLVAAMLFGFAALILIGNCIETLSYGQLSFLQFLSTAVTIAAFVVNLRRYLNCRAEKNEE